MLRMWFRQVFACLRSWSPGSIVTAEVLWPLCIGTCSQLCAIGPSHGSKEFSSFRRNLDTLQKYTCGGSLVSTSFRHFWIKPASASTSAIECASITIWHVLSVFIAVSTNVFSLGTLLAAHEAASLGANIARPRLLLTRCFCVNEKLCKAWQLSGFKRGCCDRISSVAFTS